MTKISTFVPDTEINGKDKLIGTDFNNAQKTKNFKVEDLGTHFNLVNGSRNFEYLFYNHLSISQAPVDGAFYANGNEQDPNNITHFFISKKTSNNKDVSSFFDSITAENPFDLIISQSTDLNTIFFFNISSVESISGYYKLTVSEVFFPQGKTMEFMASNLVFNLKANSESIHNNLSGLNNGDFKHLTALEKTKFDNLPNTFVTNHSQLSLNDGTNPHGTTKTDVGLSNVNNTSDADKPVSTAQQTALNLKQDNLTETNFGTFSNGLTTNDSIVDSDLINYTDVSDSNKQKKTTWSNIKAIFNTLFVPQTRTLTIGGVTQDLSANRTFSTGDMTTNTNQTVSGIKTFLIGMFGMRNVANTFTSFLTNSNTASRTYTLQDRSSTLADAVDLASKMNIPSGTTNYLSKFISATTIGISRIYDNGTFLGIGTSIDPTKDITFGNQANREFGIEESNNITDGRDLIVSAGRTVNYVPNINFNPLSQTSRAWYGICAAPNGNVYATVYGGDIYMQTGGTGNFVALGQTSRNWYRITAAPNGNVYASVENGDIYMQTGGTGNFVALGQTSRYWFGITAAPNGNVYASEIGGTIYMQTGGTGNFVSLGQTSRNWYGVGSAPNGNVYAVVNGGDIYMQTGGTGNFIGLSQTSRAWYGICAAPNGNVYAFLQGGDIYKQTGGTGNFVALGQTSIAWNGVGSAPNGNVYAVVNGGDIYMQNNNTVGSPNLNGGTFKVKAGTGKGTGNSKVQIITGQKTTSGTDMQIETVRAEFDEVGRASFFGVIKLQGYTVSTLPTGSIGDTAYVTDATTPTFLGTVVGGGSVKCRVFFNGTNWIVN